MEAGHSIQDAADEEITRDPRPLHLGRPSFGESLLVVMDGDANFVGAFPVVAHSLLLSEYLVAWEGDEDIPPLIDNEYEVFGQRLFVPEPSCWLQLVAGLACLGALYRLRRAPDRPRRC